MSIFGNTTNSTRSPFAAHTAGNASMSAFGNTVNSTRSPFAVNTAGNASTSVFGNTTNSTHNPFSFNSTDSILTSVFGISNQPTPIPSAVSTTDSATLSVFGNPNNTTPSPSALNPFGNTTSTGVFGKHPTSSFGSTAGPSRSSASPARLTNHVSNKAIRFGLFGTASASVSQPTGSIFGQSSNAVVGTRSAASPFSPSFFDLGVTQAPQGQNKGSRIKPYAVTKDADNCELLSITGMPIYESKCHEELRWEDYELKSGGVTQAPQGQNKGSRIKPYAVTKDVDNCKLLSVTGIAIYECKCHEELRWEDYELKSGGTSGSQNPINTASTGSLSSSFPPQLPVSSPVIPLNITFTSKQNPFFQRPAPSLNSTPSNIATPAFHQPSSFFPRISFPILAPSSNSTTSFTTTPPINQSSFPSFFSTTSASSSNLTPSSTTTPVFNQISSTFPNSSFPYLTPSSNSIPSTTITSVFNQPSLSFPNTFFPSPTPSSNPTLSVAMTPPFNQPSFQNPLSINPDPPLTFTPSSTITRPITKPLPTSHTLNAQPTSTPWSSLTGTGNSQINLTSSTWAAHTVTGNIGGSTDKMVDCIIAVKDPFGPQPVTSHPSIAQPTCSPLIRNGISSMPVIDKPPTTRISSLVTRRRISPRPLIVHARKYHPKSDEAKVPFFEHTNEIQSAQKKATSLIPRENPRSVFGTTSRVSGDNRYNDEMTDASSLLHEDGGKKPTKDQASSSTPQVTPSVPKLHRPDYYTQPSIQELRSVESSNPGFCSNIKDFVVGRHGYGWVKFDGETDIRGLDLDALVYFNKLEVVVYKEEHEKPVIGEGLNKAAEVTLLNVKCTDKTGKQHTSGKLVYKFMEKLKVVTEDQGAEFVSYDVANGAWKFRVKHFSRYEIIND